MPDTYTQQTIVSCGDDEVFGAMRYIYVQNSRMTEHLTACALFAIAFAVVLCEGDDQHKSSSNQQLKKSFDEC